MEKTRFGMAAPAFAALIYLLTYFGGYTPALLVVGYVLLCEESSMLKATAMKALLLNVLVSVLNLLVGFLPDLINLFCSLLRIFEVYAYGIPFVEASTSFMYSLISMAKMVVFVLLAVMALFKKDLKIGFIDKMFA